MSGSKEKSRRTYGRTDPNQVWPIKLEKSYIFFIILHAVHGLMIATAFVIIVIQVAYCDIVFSRPRAKNRNSHSSY